MLSIQNVILTKCNLYEMLPIQSVLYEMLPRQNVTIRKCTIQNVTDPHLLCKIGWMGMLCMRDQMKGKF